MTKKKSEASQNSPPKNVHVSFKRCLLPDCIKTFTPTRTGKTGLKAKKFCSPKHRRIFFKWSRKLGEVVLSSLRELEEREEMEN